MRNFTKRLLYLACGIMTLFLVGSVIHAAMALSVGYLVFSAVLLGIVILTVHGIRTVNLNRRMADVILDPEEIESRFPVPVNDLEREVGEAILLNRSLHRARRAERVARHRNIDNVIRVYGHPRD